MAATTKLIVYNDTLRELASAPLANLTSANTRLQELEGAFPHAVEYMLAKKDWSFARRRSSLTSVADTAYPPYLYRMSKPSGYLRKCWIKAQAADAHQIDHAEVAAVFYSMVPTAIMEYISDGSDNYDPANWPPHFTRCIVLYLAQLTGPKLARAGAGDIGALEGKLQAALEDADAFEVTFLTNTQIPFARLPVMRRALEIMGQQLSGSVPIHAQADMLRWAMHQAWEHTVRHALEQAAWNFASRRALLVGGAEPILGDVVSGISEGYSVPPAGAAATAPETDMSGYQYGYLLPDDFRHKIWIKADASQNYETHHQIMGRNIYCDANPAVIEYVAENDETTDPAAWPATFTEYVASRLALAVAPELVIEAGDKGRARIAAPQIRNRIEAVSERLLYDAKGKDAVQQEPKLMPVGSFVRARLGNRNGGRIYR